jgi:hypothetical protein
MNSKLVAVSLALGLSLVVPRHGAAQNGMMELEIPYNVTTEVIACLGEAVDLDLTATVRTHLIETQGGTRYVENWFLEGTAVGLVTGFTWYASGPNPFVSNAEGAQSATMLVANVTFTPLDGGQKFAERLRVQFVTDANGLVRVDKQQHQRWRCIGA